MLLGAVGDARECRDQPGGVDLDGLRHQRLAASPCIPLRDVPEERLRLARQGLARTAIGVRQQAGERREPALGQARSPLLPERVREPVGLVDHEDVELRDHRPARGRHPDPQPEREESRVHHDDLRVRARARAISTKQVWPNEHCPADGQSCDEIVARCWSEGARGEEEISPTSSSAAQSRSAFHAFRRREVVEHRPARVRRPSLEPDLLELEREHALQVGQVLPRDLILERLGRHDHGDARVRLARHARWPGRGTRTTCPSPSGLRGARATVRRSPRRRPAAYSICAGRRSYPASAARGPSAANSSSIVRVAPLRGRRLSGTSEGEPRGAPDCADRPGVRLGRGLGEWTYCIAKICF